MIRFCYFTCILIVSFTSVKCDECTELKFIENDKCIRIGKFPVKGSCKAFVQCIKYPNSEPEVLPREDCQPGEIFNGRNCVQGDDDRNCPQRRCFHREAEEEDLKDPAYASNHATDTGTDSEFSTQSSNNNAHNSEDSNGVGRLNFNATAYVAVILLGIICYSKVSFI